MEIYIYRVRIGNPTFRISVDSHMGSLGHKKSLHDSAVGLWRK